MCGFPWCIFCIVSLSSCCVHTVCAAKVSLSLLERVLCYLLPQIKQDVERQAAEERRHMQMMKKKELSMKETAAAVKVILNEVCLYVCLFVCVCLFICLFVWLSVCLFVYLSVCLSVCLLVNVSVPQCVMDTCDEFVGDNAKFVFTHSIMES